MKIGEFSKKAEISIDTLRYYDKIGLLTPKKINGKRIYTECDLKVSQAIIMLKRLNFSLEEIKSILELDQDIDEQIILNSESREKARAIMSFIKEKYDYILKQEQILIEIKGKLENMIDKTNKFLDSKD